MNRPAASTSTRSERMLRVDRAMRAAKAGRVRRELLAARARRAQHASRTDEGFSLIEVLVAVTIVGIMIAGLTTLYLKTTEYTVATASDSGARQIDQDALGYLTAAPANVLTAIAPIDAASGTSGWANAPESLPGVNAGGDGKPTYATQIRMTLVNSSAGSNNQDLRIDVQTCYTPARAGAAQICRADSVVRTGVDVSVLPPQGLGTSQVGCDGSYTATNQCTPAISTSVSANAVNVKISVVGPVAAGSTVTYSLRRVQVASPSATPDWTTGVTTVSTSGVVQPDGSFIVSDSTSGLTDSANSTYYDYRIRYSYKLSDGSTYTSQWSQTQTVTLLATHDPCSDAAGQTTTSDRSCTPSITMTDSVDGDDATPSVQASFASECPLATAPYTGKVCAQFGIVGPTDKVTYTVQRSNYPDYCVSMTSTNEADCQVSPRAITNTGPDNTTSYTLTKVATTTTWYFRVSYGTDAATGSTIWSTSTQYQVPAAS